MLLTVDIGNSYISFAYFKDDEILFVSDIVTDLYKSVDQYAVEMIQIANLYNIDVKEI